jgi:hypothetical protein
MRIMYTVNILFRTLSKYIIQIKPAFSSFESSVSLAINKVELKVWGRLELRVYLTTIAQTFMERGGL